MEKIKKIDIHIHTDMYGGREIPRFDGNGFATPVQIRELYDQMGIEKGVLLPCVSPENSFAFQANEQAAVVTEENPDLFVWFMNLDPRMAYNNPKCKLDYFIEYYKKMGAKGLGELTPNMPADCDMLDNLFYYCAEQDVPVTIHLAPDDEPYGNYGIMDSLGLVRLERMLKKHPKLKILGHSMMFWSAISGDITREKMNGYPSGKVTPGGRLGELMREYEFLYGDMSAGSGFNAFSRDEEHAYRFIEEFQDKLFFGTDICRPGQYMKLSHWLDDAAEKGYISEEAYRKVSRENAEKLLGI